jgi:hypothetical protein
MTRRQILSEISATEILTRKLLVSRPNDQDLLTAEVALRNTREMVTSRWPLTPEERKKNNLGLFATRVLEGGPYDDLPDKLLELSAHLDRD